MNIKIFYNFEFVVDCVWGNDIMGEVKYNNFIKNCHQVYLIFPMGKDIFFLGATSQLIRKIFSLSPVYTHFSDTFRRNRVRYFHICLILSVYSLILWSLLWQSDRKYVLMYRAPIIFLNSKINSTTQSTVA